MGFYKRNYKRNYDLEHAIDKEKKDVLRSCIFPFINSHLRWFRFRFYIYSNKNFPSLVVDYLFVEVEEGHALPGRVVIVQAH